MHYSSPERVRHKVFQRLVAELSHSATKLMVEGIGVQILQIAYERKHVALEVFSGFARMDPEFCRVVDANRKYAVEFNVLMTFVVYHTTNI